MTDSIYINPLTDFGFKYLFGDEGNKGSSRNAGAFVKNDGSLMLKFKRIVLRAGR